MNFNSLLDYATYVQILQLAFKWGTDQCKNHLMTYHCCLRTSAAEPQQLPDIWLYTAATVAYANIALIVSPCSGLFVHFSLTQVLPTWSADHELPAYVGSVPCPVACLSLHFSLVVILRYGARWSFHVPLLSLRFTVCVFNYHAICLRHF